MSLLVLTALSVTAKSQSAGDWWVFGHNQSLHFTGGGPVYVPGSSMANLTCVASMDDNNGNLLFYAEDDRIWCSNHNLMANGTGLNGGGESGVILMPKPGSTQFYYFFTADNTAGLQYSVIDKSLSGGLGAVVAGQKNIQLSGDVAEAVTVAKHPSGNAFWLIAHGDGNDTVYAYLVNATGVAANPIKSTPGVNIAGGVEYMKASPNSQFLAFTSNTADLVKLCRFNPYTGVASQALSLAHPVSNDYYGVEFSSNSQVLYVGTLNTKTIQQFDLTSTYSQAAILASLYMTAPTVNFPTLGAFQRGPNDKIYLCERHTLALGVINNPNNVGAACNYVTSGQALGGSTGGCYGLPQLPMFILTEQLITVEGLCASDSINFSIDTTGVAGAGWNFGDPNSLTNVDSGISVAHLFTDTGWFQVTVVYQNTVSGLLDTLTEDVFVHPGQYADLGNDTSLCVGDSILLDQSQPYATYLWSTGSQDSAIWVHNDPTVIVTVNGVCDTVSDTININFYYPFILELGSDTSICTYDSVVINTGLPNNLTFNWNSGDTLNSQLITQAGTYSVTVSDGSCTYSDSISVGNYPEVTVDLGNDSNFCYEPVAFLSPSTGNATTYAWSNGTFGPTLAVTSSNDYYLTVYGVGGYCKAMDSVRWDLWFEPVLNLGNDTSFCRDDIITLSPFAQSNFPMEYLWNDNSTQPTLNVGAIGLYWLEVSDTNCSVRDSVLIDEYPVLEVSLGEDVMGCEGDSVELIPITNDSVAGILWSTGSTSPSLSVSQSGTYSISITNGLCGAKDDINAFLLEYPKVDLGPDSSYCPGDTLDFDLSSAKILDYRWHDGSSASTISLVVRGDHKVAVSVTNINCTSIDSVKIQSRSLPEITMPSDTSFCENDTLRLEGGRDSVNQYIWSTGESTSMLDIKSPGIFTVTATDGFCENTATINVESILIPVLKMDAPEFICEGEQVVLDAQLEDIQFYKWNDGSVKPYFVAESPGVYSVEVMHPCKVVTDTVTLIDCECFVRLPSAFHPNSDGVNERFGAYVDCSFSKFHLIIFDRWGSILFETNDAMDMWDGTFKNKDVQAGSYGWQLTYEGIRNGMTFDKTQAGSLLLLR